MRITIRTVHLLLEDGTGIALQKLRAQSIGPFLVLFCSEEVEEHSQPIFKGTPIVLLKISSDKAK